MVVVCVCVCVCGVFVCVCVCVVCVCVCVCVVCVCVYAQQGAMLSPGQPHSSYVTQLTCETWVDMCSTYQGWF
jgi:hypothetical protein